MELDTGNKGCATGKWHYRTDTGDETGKVVESAELPEKGKWKRYLIHVNDECIGVEPERQPSYCVLYGSEQGFDGWCLDRDELVTDDWLRKHLIAWAEIKGGRDED